MQYKLITPIVGYASYEVEADNRLEAFAKSRALPPKVLEVIQLLDPTELLDPTLCETMLERLEWQKSIVI